MKSTLRALQLITVVLTLGACAEQAPTAAATLPAASAAPATTQAHGSTSTPAPAALGGRTGELVNPDESTMVFLYHEIAGVAAPFDQWVENDSRVTVAAGPDKAARREQVRAELSAALAAVRDIGYIRLTLNDRLSDYDPGYEEFTLRALAPSSTIDFKALQQEVALRFGNGRNAQIWAVPAAQAQAVQDSFRYGRDVALDLLLKITAVQPATRGGTIVTEVLEYEIRTQQGNKLLGRVTPTPQ